MIPDGDTKTADKPMDKTTGEAMTLAERKGHGEDYVWHNLSGAV